MASNNNPHLEKQHRSSGCCVFVSANLVEDSEGIAHDGKVLHSSLECNV